MPTARRPTGLTLVEALVVLGILAVLAGVLLPVLLRARGNARRTLCLSNLRQLGSGCTLYAQDYGGRLPPYRNEWPGVGYGEAYPDARALHASLQPYVRNTRVWYCPSDPLAGKDVLEEKWQITHLFSSYFFNTRKSRRLRIDGYVNASGTRYHPAEYILISDANRDVWDADKGQGEPRPDCQHFRGKNLLFLDGHAKWYRHVWDLPPVTGRRRAR